jgi:hypothetical protein
MTAGGGAEAAAERRELWRTILQADGAGVNDIWQIEVRGCGWDMVGSGVGRDGVPGTTQRIEGRGWELDQRLVAICV